MADSPTTQKFQRRTILIKRQLQFKYIGVVILSALFAALIVGGDIYYNMVHIILNDNPSLGTTVAQFNSIILIKIGLLSLLMMAVALYVSHRFAGPIHRFEKSAQAVSSGDLTHRVSLRTGDELLELQEEFNGMVASLQSMVQKDRNLASRLSERLGAVLRRLPEGQDALGEDLRSIQIELEHLTKTFQV